MSSKNALVYFLSLKDATPFKVEYRPDLKNELLHIDLIIWRKN